MVTATRESTAAAVTDEKTESVAVVPHWLWKPGQSGNPAGRPRKGQTFKELAEQLPVERKQEVIASQYRAAVKKQSTRAAEFLRDTAEGKPATRIIVQQSVLMTDIEAGLAELDQQYVDGVVISSSAAELNQ